MSDKLGQLEYDLTIDEKNLDKTIKSIDSKLKSKNKDWEKYLSIDFSQATKGAISYQKILREQEQTEKQRFIAAQQRASASSAAEASAVRTAEVARKSAVNALLDEQKLASAKSRTAKAQLALEQAQRRSATQADKTSSSYKKQSLYLQNLNTLAASYASIFAVARIADKIREVTGEFELQNKALGAILQNKEKADQLFGQVTDLALKSPFSIKELLTYTKQLAAYRIETENLIPTLTQLADVSAGLGVDMSRLILAYGQVRAASVLRGTELRQFTEAGIPMVQLLADKFSILEGRVVSTNEVFDKISNRLVSFAMVSEIFEDMTSQGGIFFEAQAVQAKTLAGMWNILGDAIDKAMYQIGTENMDILKGAVQVATDLTRSWRDVLDVIKVLIATYGVFAISIKFTTGAIIKNKVALALMSGITKEAAISQGILTAAEAAHIPVAQRLGTAMQNLSIKMKAVASGNWVGLLLTALTAIGVALYNAKQRSDEAREAFEEGIKPMLAQAETLDRIEAALKNSNTSEQERIKLIKEAEKATDGVVRANKDEAESIKDIAYQKALLRAETAISEAEFELGDAFKASQKAKEDAEADIDKVLRSVESKFLLFKERVRNIDLSDTVDGIISPLLDSNKKFENEGKRAVAVYNALTGELARRESEYDLQYQSLGATGSKAASDRIKVLKKEISEIEDILDLTKLKNSVDEYYKKWRIVNDATKASVSATEGLIKNIDLFAASISKNLGRPLEEVKDDLLDFYGIKPPEPPKDGIDEKQLSAVQRTIKSTIEDVKELRSISREGFGSGAQIKDDQSVSDYFESILTKQEEYKKKVVDLEKIEAAIAANKTKRSKDEIEAAKRNIESTKDLQVLYDTLAKLFDLRKKSASTEKDAADNLRNQVELLTDIKKAREDLSVSLGKDDTEEAIQKIFKTRADDLGVTIPVTSDTTAFYDQLKDIATQAEKLGTDAGKALSKAINSQISNAQTKDLVDNAKQAIKDINDEINAYKGKVDFYNDILGISKDEEFTFKLAFDVDTDGLERIIRDKIAELDKGIELGIGEDIVGKSFEDLFSKSEIEGIKSRLSGDEFILVKKLYGQLSSIQEKSFKDELSRLVAVRKDFRESEEEKVAIRAKYAKLRADLDSEYNNQTLEEREGTLRRLSKSEGLELAKVDATILASTKAYKALYSDMERYSVGKMKGIAKVWDNILDKIDSSKSVDGFTTITFKDLDNTTKTLTLTEEQIENLRKATVKLNKEIYEKDPFKKISKGFKDVGDAANKDDFAQGLELAGEGVSELLGMINPLIGALDELAGATGDTGMANFADDLRIASEWGDKLIKLGVGIAKAAAGDPTALIQSTIDITATLIKAEAAYQAAKRAFLADQLKMEREYVLLLLQEQALFKDGLSIFDVNQFGQAANQINVIRDATAAYKDEVVKLGDAEVKTGVKRKKAFGITVGKKDIYGKLLEEFPEIIKNQDDIIKKTEEWNVMGLKLQKTMFEVGENAEIDVNVAKSILATEKLDDATRATLEQLIALQEQIDAANQAISDYLGSVFGQLGADLSDALVEAFRAGDQASLDFANNVSSTMEKLAQDIGNSLILAPYFEKFEKKLNEIYKDGSLTPEEQFAATSKVMADFYAGLEAEQEEYAKFLAQAQEEAAKYGLDIFGDQTDELGALAKGIEGVTEDTARRLEAMLNSIREISIVDSSKMSEIVSGINIQSAIATQSIAHLQSIDNNVLAFRSAFESVLTNAQNTGGTGLKVYIQ